MLGTLPNNVASDGNDVIISLGRIKASVWSVPPLESITDRARDDNVILDIQSTPDDWDKMIFLRKHEGIEVGKQIAATINAAMAGLRECQFEVLGHIIDHDMGLYRALSHEM